MTEEREPPFEFVPDHPFKKGEKVYVIDPNGYDIWEGQITDVKDNTYHVHYPEYPEDDGPITETAKRVLVQTKRNKDIFTKQEKIRAERENQEEDDDYVDEDDE